MEDGFYWVICPSDDHEMQVAELCDGDWWLTGKAKPFSDEEIQVQCKVALFKPASPK